jgi:hypothetical protein
MSPTTPLHQLEVNLRAVGRQARELVALAHFDLFISPTNLDHMTLPSPGAGPGAGGAGVHQPRDGDDVGRGALGDHGAARACRLPTA